MKDIKVFYHSADLDGLMSGAIMKSQFPNAEFEGWDYKDPIPKLQDLLRYKHIYLVDITFPIAFLNLLGESIKITVIDHHISFRKQAHQLETLNFEYVYDDKLSACEIAYKHFIGNEIPFLVKVIGEYDTWRTYGNSEKWKSETLPINLELKYNITNIEEGESLLEFADEYETIDGIHRRGKRLYSYVRQDYDNTARDFSFERACFDGLRGLFLNVHLFNADMLSSVYDPNKHDILIGFNIVGDVCKVSLRCPDDKDIDVSEIAKRYGGGGHKKASAFMINNISKIFNN